jgi:hypothetical protein
MTLHRFAKIGLFAAITAVALLGIIVADAVTKPLSVQLRSDIQICKKDEKGGWTLIDEVGPANLQFDASLVDLAAGSKIQSSFVWTAKSKNGQDYSVRLAEPADIKFDVKSGQLTGDLKFSVSWKGKSAIVPAHITTESLSTPLGAKAGKRAHGLLGLEPVSVSVVSANDLQLAGEASPLKLVCLEEYTLTPKK